MILEEASSIESRLVGVSFGLWMYVYTLAVQNTAAPCDMGAAVSTLTFARQVGGAMGASVFGAVFVLRFASELAACLPQGASPLRGGEALTLEAVRGLPRR